MTKEEIKPTVDEMILKVLQYMSEALEDDKEFYELSIECAASFMMCDIDLDSNMIQIIDDMRIKHSSLLNTMIDGIFEYKEGKRSKTNL